VTKEVFKQIYVKEGLQPPTLDAVKSAYSSLWSQVTSPALVGNLVKSGDLGRVGFYGLQAYGIFKVCGYKFFSSVLALTNLSSCHRLERS